MDWVVSILRLYKLKNRNCTVIDIPWTGRTIHVMRFLELRWRRDIDGGALVALGTCICGLHLESALAFSI